MPHLKPVGHLKLGRFKIGTGLVALFSEKVFRNGEQKTNRMLVVEPTHLKNMLVKFRKKFPQLFGLQNSPNNHHL